VGQDSKITLLIKSEHVQPGVRFGSKPAIPKQMAGFAWIRVRRFAELSLYHKTGLGD
jgi:hypothetical protein